MVSRRYATHLFILERSSPVSSKTTLLNLVKLLKYFSNYLMIMRGLKTIRIMY